MSGGALVSFQRRCRPRVAHFCQPAVHRRQLYEYGFWNLLAQKTSQCRLRLSSRHLWQTTVRSEGRLHLTGTRWTPQNKTGHEGSARYSRGLGSANDFRENTVQTRHSLLTYGLSATTAALFVPTNSFQSSSCHSTNENTNTPAGLILSARGWSIMLVLARLGGCCLSMTTTFSGCRLSGDGTFFVFFASAFKNSGCMLVLITRLKWRLRVACCSG